MQSVDTLIDQALHKESCHCQYCEEGLKNQERDAMANAIRIRLEGKTGLKRWTTFFKLIPFIIKYGQTFKK